jgi:hypothetical protein
MTKATRTPLENFFRDSLRWARSRDSQKGWAKDESISVATLVGIYYGQNGRCCWTGQAMSLIRSKGGGANTAFDLCTIERRDNSMGYVAGNLRLARDGINRMRGDMTEEQFGEVCRAIGNRA